MYIYLTEINELKLLYFFLKRVEKLIFRTMKKTFLTLVAVGFSFSVAFAQTETVETPQPETQEQTAPAEEMTAQEEGRTEVEMAALPVAVQDAFKNGQYSNYEVLAIYEVSAESTEAVATEGTVYEFELAEKAGAAETTEVDGVELETEKVSERQPDVVLFIDENGQVIEESTEEQE